MIVTRSQFTDVLASLELEPGPFSLDCEATGLRVYHDSRLFSVIISSGEETYYFNFQDYPDCDREQVLPREWILKFSDLLGNPNTLWFMHNAKYDLGLLTKEGLKFQGVIHCTEAIARVVRNDHLKYSLDACVERLGLKKSEAVEKYIKEHKPYTKEEIPGKDKLHVNKHFWRVPFSVIAPYGLADGQITYALGLHQISELTTTALSTPCELPNVLRVLNNERKLTKTLFKMEQYGIRIDPEYCMTAASYEQAQYEKAEAEFEKLSGIPFTDSNKVLAHAFTKMGEEYPLTEKGNPSFTDDVLSTFTTPLARVVQDYRSSRKKCHTYYRNFLWHRDENNLVHANIRQGGTGTGRVSCSDPNLQNLSKEEDFSQPFLIRRSFIPREGRFFFMIDYDQMEYRMMVDKAGETGLIRLILDEGLDVHAATAILIKRSRAQAKTINFGLLYGIGAAELARQLGCTVPEAKEMKASYFKSLPRVRDLIRGISGIAEQRGYIFNWLGRRSYFQDKRFCYKAPNYWDQGGCADVVKVAMNQIDELLWNKQTKMVMQIHDEILFEGVEEEKSLIPEIKTIMESVYPYRYLPLTCSVSHSYESWADKKEGVP